MSSLPASFDDEVLEVIDDEVRLIGAWCPSCAAFSFPRTDMCPRCSAVTERRPLARRGKVFARVVINAPVTIHPTPATIVQVVLDGVRIGGLLRNGEPVIDGACELMPLEFDRGGDPVTAFCFDMVDEGA